MKTAKRTKKIRLFILFAILATFLVSSVLAGREERKRKLPVGSYITSAKIEILSRDPERVKLALGFLSDLADFYGPHSEGYYWTSQIYYDYIDNVASPMEKKEYVLSLVVYSDSLSLSCDNQEIKKKYRKGCEGFSEKVDSIKVLLWRQYYNDGVEMLKEVGVTKTEMDDDPDSASQGYYREKIDELRDTAQAFFELAIVLDSAKEQPWIGIGNLLQELDKLEEANEMLIRALSTMPEENKGIMLKQVAYNFVNNRQAPESIPYLREYIEKHAPEDVPAIMNMALIYNQVDKADSAYYLYLKVIEFDSTNQDALVGAGRYHNQQAIGTFDSARHYRETDETAKLKEWEDKRDSSFASSREMFAKAYRLSDSTNISIAKDYGLALYLLADYETAVEPFGRIAANDPGDKDNWITLGNCYLKLKDFDKCARAYEKVVEIDPDHRSTWESLAGLYKELRETENEKRAKEHLK